MTYKMITDDIIDEMLNDVFMIKLNSYINCTKDLSNS